MYLIALALYSPALINFAKTYPKKNPPICNKLIANINFAVTELKSDLNTIEIESRLFEKVRFFIILSEKIGKLNCAAFAADIVPHIPATVTTERNGVIVDAAAHS